MITGLCDFAYLIVILFWFHPTQLLAKSCLTSSTPRATSLAFVHVRVFVCVFVLLQPEYAKFVTLLVFLYFCC